MQRLIKTILSIAIIIVVCILITMLTISRDQSITEIIKENETANKIIKTCKEKTDELAYELEVYMKNLKSPIENKEDNISELETTLKNSEEMDISEYVSSSAEIKLGELESFDSDNLNYKIELLDNGKEYYNYKNTYKKSHTEIQLTYPILAGFSHDELSEYRQRLWNGGKFLNYEEYVELCKSLLIKQTYNNENNNYIVLMYPFDFGRRGTQLTDLVYNKQNNKITGYIFYQPQTYVTSYSNNQVIVIPTDKDFKKIPKIELVNMFELNTENLSYIPEFNSLDRNKVYISSCKNDKEISIECTVLKQIEYSYNIEFMLKQTDKFNYEREILINGNLETIFFKERPSGPDS